MFNRHVENPNEYLMLSWIKKPYFFPHTCQRAAWRSDSRLCSCADLQFSAETSCCALLPISSWWLCSVSSLFWRQKPLTPLGAQTFVLTRTNKHFSSGTVQDLAGQIMTGKGSNAFSCLYMARVKEILCYLILISRWSFPEDALMKNTANMTSHLKVNPPFSLLFQKIWTQL